MGGPGTTWSSRISFSSPPRDVLRDQEIDGVRDAEARGGRDDRSFRLN